MPRRRRLGEVDILLTPADLATRVLECYVVDREPLFNPEVAELVASEWRKYGLSQRRIGGHSHLTSAQLFRFESVSLAARTVRLCLSQTDFREVYGTNIRHPELETSLGHRFMGNALGVCTTVITADGKYVIFRRSKRVLELPGFYHLCAGHLERHKGTIGRGPRIETAVRSELREELGVTDDEIRHVRPIGMSQSLLSFKHEMLYSTTLTVGSEKLSRHRLNFEHDYFHLLLPKPAAEFLGSNWHVFVPAGKAALLLQLWQDIGRAETASLVRASCGSTCSRER